MTFLVVPTIMSEKNASAGVSLVKRNSRNSSRLERIRMFEELLEEMREDGMLKWCAGFAAAFAAFLLTGIVFVALWDFIQPLGAERTMVLLVFAHLAFPALSAAAAYKRCAAMEPQEQE